MSTTLRCDFCQKAIIGEIGALHDIAPGDGNEYRVEIWINEVDTRGWNQGDYHKGCLVQKLTELLKVMRGY